jgi:hypothetical protein
MYAPLHDSRSAGINQVSGSPLLTRGFQILLSYAKRPVKKSKVGLFFKLLLTHPYSPLYYREGITRCRTTFSPSLGERGMQGGEFEKRLK